MPPPCATKRSRSAKLAARSAVHPKTLPPRTKGRTARPLSPSARSVMRSEEHTSELQSLMRISYAVFCLKKKKERWNIRTNEIEETIDENIATDNTKIQER